MKILRFIFFPIAFIYWVITSVRNRFYEKGIMKSSKFGVPVINVGNLNMGGTGKTPHVEYLIRLLQDNHKVATLSRGFGRKQRGFIIADENSTAEQIGDEPLQYYRKFGDRVIVSVEADRVLGAMDLFREHEDIEVLLLDDAFQHRKIFAGVNILLTDYSDPYYKDFILPVGNLRESRSGKKRADIIIVTKCPQDLTEEDKTRMKLRIKPENHQKIFFSKIRYGDVVDFKGNQLSLDGKKVVVVTGIANPTPLIEKISANTEIIQHFKFGDHHKFKATELKEIHNLFNKFAHENSVIVTTEKDAMRLMSPELMECIKDYPWCYQRIEVKIDEEDAFNKLILNYVEENN
ncbi:MAG: tetraacyldisaccharide 4'-kinase [Crocinitomicaceae bacterium]|nr:tetraacyldisaccharide 4'-kinase [Crocinitomicaceae bacterium]